MSERRYPPPGVELREIARFVPFSGRRVLEIGCGDGRLTFQYADRVASVVAIDTDAAAIARARRTAARRGVAHVRFATRSATRFEPGRRSFDVILFSYSL